MHLSLPITFLACTALHATAAAVDGVSITLTTLTLTARHIQTNQPDPARLAIDDAVSSDDDDDMVIAKPTGFANGLHPAVERRSQQLGTPLTCRKPGQSCGSKFHIRKSCCAGSTCQRPEGKKRGFACIPNPPSQPDSASLLVDNAVDSDDEEGMAIAEPTGVANDLNPAAKRRSNQVRIPPACRKPGQSCGQTLGSFIRKSCCKGSTCQLPEGQKYGFGCKPNSPSQPGTIDVRTLDIAAEDNVDIHAVKSSTTVQEVLAGPASDGDIESNDDIQKRQDAEADTDDDESEDDESNDDIQKRQDGEEDMDDDMSEDDDSNDDDLAIDDHSYVKRSQLLGTPLTCRKAGQSCGSSLHTRKSCCEGLKCERPDGKKGGFACVAS